MDPMIERAIAERASSQLGLLTRSQARSAGMSAKSIRHRLDSGAWRLVGNSVLWPAVLADGVHLRIMAACLDVGGVASHRTAAWLDAPERVPPPDPLEVLLRKGGSVRTTPLARTHLTTSLPEDDVRTVAGIPTTSAARTLLGLAGLVPAEISYSSFTGSVEEAVRAGRASDRWLWWLLEERRCRGRDGVRVLESVLAERARLGPTESWLEREALRVLEAAGLPLPTVQHVVRRQGAFVSRVDLAYVAERVLIEVEGKDHDGHVQRAVDAHQRNQGQLLGHTVLTYTYEQVVRSPHVLVAEVREALHLAWSRRVAAA
ncbi:DUF559 domain-containing protein [Iamia majanohamensis]|uniref:DUF559 domain-containing protein n=1 Tax=Iamia majanohamensis TaxID=467976 RepID=A0AAE9Y8T7_9ACTN|nr:DUF559 domain-containing protein [Iamia majanohamensis]WCO68880.1 DUF559 domain-containing protein [Iamia majanohamensis]